MAAVGQNNQLENPLPHSEELQTPSAISVTGVYAGSFDPFTLAHKDIAQRAARICSEVIIAIGVNSSKLAMFTPEEKKALIEEELKDVKGNFRVVVFEGLLAHFALSCKASILIRGVRGITDIPVESQLASINREQSGFEDLETIFLPSRKEYENVSSSATKELIKNGGDVRNYVSRRIETAMLNKIAGNPIFPSASDPIYEMMDPETAEKIVLDRWYDLSKRLRISASVARDIGEQIVTTYKEPHRKYHNLVHIAEGLQAIDGFRDHIAALDAFELAWFFHDFVYDPSDTTKGSNELKSKERLIDISEKIYIPQGILKRASQFIDATVSHKIYEEDLDGAFFIDTDLWILGSSSQRYQKYSKDLRDEFGIYSDQQFNSGRIKFIQKMLERDQIYKTDYFSSQFEANIKSNLQQEISTIVWGSVFAVTGSIGSGKSSVMKLLEANGAYCLSADVIAAELREPGTDTFDKIVAHFGKEILTDDQTIDRKALGRIVFSDPEQRVILEQILQPEIERVTLERFTQKVIERAPLLAYEVPVLFEAGLENRGFKKIVFVCADKETRIKRITTRDNCTEEQAVRKMEAQLPDDEKIAKSDIIVDNSADLDFLLQQVSRILD